MFVALCREEEVEISGAATPSSTTETRPAEPTPASVSAPTPASARSAAGSPSIAGGVVIRGVRSLAEAGVTAGMLPEVRSCCC